jgi:hypothetical protein
MGLNLIFSKRTVKRQIIALEGGSKLFFERSEKENFGKG